MTTPKTTPKTTTTTTPRPGRGGQGTRGAMAAGDPIDRPFLRDVDQWMEQLYDCKQLSEQQVKMLFEQVRNAVEKLAEYLKTSGY
ncbi:hypothetical protein PRIPAC_73120 [Pristionchus pacificus]|uniref:Uncharacterized protein n=1 Tax=Pristionchus pacificus TaxID=54126 RepID=A0A2A6CG76_PRIPA|nr:hypothetical protein PRIPAC_73120 [Pristionchus pacificus]|eukprot:PDM77063.1 hypothetical protein PRIPAC_42458 [Pristionchus pacificus]